MKKIELDGYSVGAFPHPDGRALVLTADDGSEEIIMPLPQPVADQLAQALTVEVPSG